MKRIVALILASALTFTITACSRNSSDTDFTDHVAYITLGDTITIVGEGAIVEGNAVSITAAGTYYISGASSNAQIRVYTESTGTFNLILNGVDIACSESAPIYIINADKTVITLADGTENFITDGTSYILENSASDEPNAAIFSNDDLTINGNGSLTVNANYNDGIKSHDDLNITGGDITVNAAYDGIIGKDSLTVKDGAITINASGDGMRASNDEDAAEGYISIEGGTINITAGEEGLQAETAITIEGGDIDVNSSGDAFDSNGMLTINVADIMITSGDKGLDADNDIEINGGYINIKQCYEGIEGQVITINGGDINIVSVDDGISVSIGCKSRAKVVQGLCNESRRERAHLYINSGVIAIDAGDDSLDIEGPMDMTGGAVIIKHWGKATIDNGNHGKATVEINGGLFLAIDTRTVRGSTEKISPPQLSVVLNYQSLQPSGTMIHIETESGQDILTFVPTEAYLSIALCSHELEKGITYIVYSGGSSTGNVSEGLYSGGIYTAGSELGSFTIYNTLTSAVFN